MPGRVLSVVMHGVVSKPLKHPGCAPLFDLIMVCRQQSFKWMSDNGDLGVGIQSLPDLCRADGLDYVQVPDLVVEARGLLSGHVKRAACAR